MNGNGAPGRGSIGNIVIMTVILCAIVASVIIIAFKLTGGSGDVTTTDPSLTTPPTTTAPVTTQKPSDGFKVENYTASDVHIGPLAIVNSKIAYDFEAQKDTNAKLYDSIPALAAVAANGIKARDYTVLLNMATINDLKAMLTAFNAEVPNVDIVVKTGYRNFEDQQALYGDGSSSFVSAPGHTAYHTGYAFDVRVSIGGEEYPLNSGQIPKEINNWFNLHAHEYGFVERYPSSNGAETDYPTGISGIFRYVGVPHATYMFNEGLCFEEYLKVLSETSYENPLEITISDNETYHVYFEAGSGASNAVHVPTDRPYSVSGNNSNGYIVTVNG